MEIGDSVIVLEVFHKKKIEYTQTVAGKINNNYVLDDGRLYSFISGYLSYTCIGCRQAGYISLGGISIPRFYIKGSDYDQSR